MLTSFFLLLLPLVLVPCPVVATHFPSQRGLLFPVPVQEDTDLLLLKKKPIERRFVCMWRKITDACPYTHACTHTHSLSLSPTFCLSTCVDIFSCMFVYYVCVYALSVCDFAGCLVTVDRPCILVPSAEESRLDLSGVLGPIYWVRDSIVGAFNSTFQVTVSCFDLCRVFYVLTREKKLVRARVCCCEHIGSCAHSFVRVEEGACPQQRIHWRSEYMGVCLLVVSVCLFTCHSRFALHTVKNCCPTPRKCLPATV